MVEWARKGGLPGSWSQVLAVQGLVRPTHEREADTVLLRHTRQGIVCPACCVPLSCWLPGTHLGGVVVSMDRTFARWRGALVRLAQTRCPTSGGSRVGVRARQLWSKTKSALVYIRTP